MSNFNNASLIVTPNAVKAGKLYSIKPTNGAGDLDVVRATSATRVDENGLIEIPATNLCLQSDMFANPTWNKINTTVSANTIISPSGLQDADTLTANGTNNAHFTSQNILVSAGITYTISYFLKKGTNNFAQITGGLSPFGLDVWANFDLENGLIGSKGSLTTAKIENYGNGWYRCSITGNAISNSNTNAIGAVIISNLSSVRGETNTLSTSVYLWGAQLEQGVTATEYIPTTTVVRTRFAGITQDGSSASNIPRLDYTNGSCPSILVEPQRTNLVFPSATATTQTRTVTAAAHTLSFYGTGNVTLSGVATGTLNGTGANNRVTLTFTPTAGSLILTVIGSVTNWQLEAGSNATSLIQTVSTSVTRNADVISKSGISSLIGQTEGSIYIEAYNTPIQENFKSLIILYQGTNIVDNNISLATGNGGVFMRLSVTINGVNATTSTFTLPNNQLNKICITYTSSTIKVFLNGAQRGGTLSVIGPYTFDKLDLGNRDNVRQWGAPIYDTFISKTALSDAEAIQLTTL